MAGPRRQAFRGFVLIEVLLAVGLLGVVTGCLLAAFQRSRRIERELRVSVGEVESRNRLVEFLQLDLMRARTILVDDVGTSVSPSLNLLLGSDGSLSTIDQPIVAQYTWTANEEVQGKDAPDGERSRSGVAESFSGAQVSGTLRRTEQGPDGQPVSMDLGELPCPEFEFVAEEGANDRGARGVASGVSGERFGASRSHQTGSLVRLVRLRFRSARDNVETARTDDLSFPLAVPLPISLRGAVRP